MGSIELSGLGRTPFDIERPISQVLDGLLNSGPWQASSLRDHEISEAEDRDHAERALEAFVTDFAKAAAAHGFPASLLTDNGAVFTAARLSPLRERPSARRSPCSG